MNQRLNAGDSWARANWFYFVAVAIISCDFFVIRVFGWGAIEKIEAALLFDFVIILPALYWWCYRLRGTATIIRAVAMGCFAIWIAGHIIPPEHQNILSTYGWLRYVGLAGLVAVELKVVVFVYISVFSGHASKADVTDALAQVGMPLWLSRLIAAEALFWRRVWDSAKRIFAQR